MKKVMNKKNKINLKIFVLFFVCLIGFVVFSNLGSAYILDEACAVRTATDNCFSYSLSMEDCPEPPSCTWYNDECQTMEPSCGQFSSSSECNSKMICYSDYCNFCEWYEIPGFHQECIVGSFEAGTACCVDLDEDGYYINNSFCPGPLYDCDNADPNINPNATEICGDGIDNNCDGLIDCEDIQCVGTSCGTGNDGICCAEQGCVYDNDGDGFYPCEYLGNESSPCGEFTNYDCKDDNVNINPSRNEICNDNLDNNCNGLVDCDDPSCRGQINSQGNRCCSEKVDCGQCNYCAGNVCETVPDYTNDCSKVSCALCVQGSCNWGFSRSNYLDLLNRETSFNSSFSLVSSSAGICWDGSSWGIARDCAANNVFFDQANSLNALTYNYVNYSSIYNDSIGRGVYYRTIKIKNPCGFWGDYYLIPVESEGVSVSVEGVGSINYLLSLYPGQEKEIILKIDTTYAMEDNPVLEVLLQNYNYYYSWNLYYSPSAKLNLSLVPLKEENYNISFSENSWEVIVNDASNKETLGNLLSKSITISNNGLENINHLYYLPTGENAGNVLIRPSMSGRTLKAGENFTVKFNLIVDEGTEDFVLPIRFMWLNQSKEFNISFIQNATNYPEQDSGWSYNVSVLGQNFNTQASWWSNYWYRYHYYYPSYWYYNDYYYHLHGIYPSRYYYWDYWYGWYYGWWGSYCSDSDICVQNYPWNHPWYSRWWRYWGYYLSWYGRSVGIYSSSGQLSIPSELNFSSSLFNTEVKSNYLENSIIRYQTNSLNNDSFYKSLWIYASPTISSEYLISPENLSNLNEAKTTLDYYLHRNSRSTSNSASPRTIFTLSLENVTGGYNLNLDCVSSGSESTSQFCSDGLDNDCDGLVDCFDSDCCSVGVCQGTSSCPAYEICDDGIDNSGNGLIDCEDTNACCGFGACVGIGDCIEEYSLYGEVFSQTITNVTTIFNGEEVLREPGFRARLKNNFNYSIMNIENQGRELFDFEIVSPSQDVNLSDIQIEIGEDWISAKGYSGEANFYVPKTDGDCENIYECPGNIWDCNIGTKVDESRITDLGYACLVTNVSGTAIKNQKDIILTTWHENDFGVAYSGYNRGINEPILFYTNISNSTDNQQILGAVCEISFEDLPTEAMVWDEEKSIYYSNFTFTELENYVYNVSCDSLNISVMHNLDLNGSVKTTPLENQSRLENLGENAFAYYAQMYIEYNNGGSWEYVSTVLNDSQTETLRTLEVGEVLGLDTIWNPNAWNTSENVGDGTYRVVVDLVDNEGNLLYDEEKSSFLTTSFEFYLDSSSPILIVSNYTGYTNQSVSLQLSATDENGIDFWWIDDEINFEINNSGFVTNLTELSSGVYPLGVFVNDSYGNLANGEVLITILDSCTESLVNTSESAWTNLTCVLDQMNQSQFWVEYDENNCGNFTNVTHYAYQLVGPIYQNTSWSEYLDLECLPTDYYNQTRNLTEFDIYGCAENTTYFEYRDDFEECDYCVVNLTNTSWSEWINDSVCLPGDNQQQISNLTQYDSNNCGEEENQTFYQYQNISCDYCTPSLANTTKSNWTNISCLESNLMNQSQFWVEYDENNCSEVENVTYTEYQNTEFCLYNNFILIENFSIPSSISIGIPFSVGANVVGEGIDSVLIGITLNGIETNYSMQNISSNYFKSFTFWQNGERHFKIYASSSFGLYNESNVISKNVFISGASVQVKTALNETHVKTLYKDNEIVNLTDPPLNNLETNSLFLDSFSLFGGFSSGCNPSQGICTSSCSDAFSFSDIGPWSYGSYCYATSFEFGEIHVRDDPFCNNLVTGDGDVAVSVFGDGDGFLCPSYDYNGGAVNSSNCYTWTSLECDSFSDEPSCLSGGCIWDSGYSFCSGVTCSLATEYSYSQIEEYFNFSSDFFSESAEIICEEGFIDCDGICVNLLIDPNNCGSCGNDISSYCGDSSPAICYGGSVYCCGGCVPNNNKATPEENQSILKNEGNTSFGFYFLMGVEHYNEVGWELLDIVINDSNLDYMRISESEYVFGLDTIWNPTGKWNSSNNIGSGTYRVFVSANDPEGNILEDELNGPLYATFNFTIDVDSPELTFFNYTGYTNESVSLQLLATDENGISSWEINDTSIFEINSSGFVTNKTSLTIGEFWRTIIVNDSLENSATGEILITILDSCTESLVNTSKSSWENTTCSLDKMNQSQFWIEYDENNCGDFTNVTHYDYQLVGPTYVNTSWTDWANLSCLETDFYNQSRNLTEFDIYGCAINVTYFEYRDDVEICDYCVVNLTNTSWSEWINDSVCLPDDNQQQVSNLTQYDSNDCGEVENQTFYQYQNISCDFCTPSLTNTSKSEWENLGSCLITDEQNQSQNWTEYDENDCGEVTNVTRFGYQTIPCDYCSPSLQNNTGEWEFLGCIENLGRYQRVVTEYDENYDLCYAITGLESDLFNNNSFFEYNWIEEDLECICVPNLVNITSLDWYSYGVCLINDIQQEIREMKEYDLNNCGDFENRTFYEYRNVSCDHCTPVPTNSSLTEWSFVGECNITDLRLKQRNFTQYDSNNCYFYTGLESDIFENSTYFELVEESCDYCSYSVVNTSWSSWLNLDCVNTTSRNQTRFLTEYDENYESCYDVTRIESDLWNSGNNNTYYDYRVIADPTCGPYCGDGICNNGETCSSCSVDCGSCGGGGSPDPEEPEVPEEPEEPSCEDECSSGENYKTCFDSKTISEKTCGNYDEDECLEWSSSTKTSCPSLTSCSSGNCIPINCDSFWTCSSWGECSLGNQTRTCTNTVCNLPSKVEYQSCLSCIENWKCDYTSCSVGDEYSFPYDCVDSNYCGTFEKMPTKKECSLEEEDPLEKDPENPSEDSKESSSGETGSSAPSCVSSFVCQSWGECDASYSLQNIVDGITSVSGVQRRECVDSNKCAPTKTESKFCELKIEVLAKKTSWCNENYTEIYDSSSNKLLTRIKETKNIFSISGVNIDFLEGDFSGYCGYCYDGIKNYDEEGVDCGGDSCPACVPTLFLFDWARIVSIISWTFFLLLFLFLTLTNVSDLKNILFSAYYKAAYFEEMFEYKINSILSKKGNSPKIIKARLDRNLKGAKLSDIKISHLKKDFLNKSLKRRR